MKATTRDDVQLVNRTVLASTISALLAGGGVKGGFVYGKSDANAMFPDEHPVKPEDLAATLFHLMGIDPASEIYDRNDRPLVIGGRPLTEIMA